MSETIAQAVIALRSSVLLGSLDEPGTKQGIVLRLLSLAGWDAFDLSEVVPEYTVGSRRVDYALRVGSANRVFIEVKRPSENLEEHQQQLLDYCFQEGVKLAVLTNGRTWWLYLPLREGSWEQRRFLTIDLESQEPEVVQARFIEFLSRDEVGTGNAVNTAEELVQSQRKVDTIRETIVKAWNEIIEAPDELLVDLISEATERICGFKPDSGMVKEFLAQHVSTPRVSTAAAPPTSFTPPEPAGNGGGKGEPLPQLRREELSQLEDGQVLICPSRPDGVDFFMRYRAWGFIRLREQPRYVALYVAQPESAIRFLGEVERIVDHDTAPKGMRSVYQWEGWPAGKKALLFKPGRAWELAEPISLGGDRKKAPRGPRGCTLSDLARARTMDDL
ncbi:MAG: hypothetical protein ACE5JL_06000 [Dehalococcoidia bacterium]